MIVEDVEAICSLSLLLSLLSISLQKNILGFKSSIITIIQQLKLNNN